MIGALIGAGLRLEFFHEHEQIPWRAFPMMVETGEDLFELPEGFPRIPLSYSLKAVKGE